MTPCISGGNGRSGVISGWPGYISAEGGLDVLCAGGMDGNGYQFPKSLQIGMNSLKINTTPNINFDKGWKTLYSSPV